MQSLVGSTFALLLEGLSNGKQRSDIFRQEKRWKIAMETAKMGLVAASGKRMKEGLKVKRVRTALLTVLTLLCLSAAALASPPVLDVSTIITPTSTTTSPLKVEQGQSLILTATTSFLEPGTGFFSSENWDGATVITPASGSGNSFVSTASFSAAGKGTGTYTVTYTITLQRGGGAGTVNGSDEDTAYLEVIEQTQTIIILPMAAPAVAAKILSYNGVQPGYKVGKKAGNYISEVALHMGPQTMFDGVSKSALVDGTEVSNPAYRQAVLDFLNHLANMQKDLVMPPDSFFAQ